MTNSRHPETLSLHAGWRADATTGSVAVPIHQTTSYQFRDTEHASNLFALKELGNIYTRIGNPTVDVLEQRVAALEGGVAALTVASGMAAITAAIQTLAEAGDNIVSSSRLYGGTYNLFAHTFPRQGLEVRFADPRDPDSFARLIDHRTRAVFCETIGNPLGNVTDIGALAAVAHAAGVPEEAITPFWRVLDETSPTTGRLPDGVAFVRARRAAERLGG